MVAVKPGDVPPDAKSYRVTRDRAGRWHVAFAVIPDPVPGPGTREVVGIDRGIKVSAALSTGEMLTVPGLSGREAARRRRLERKLARAGRGSSRRREARARVARMKSTEASRRKDWAEKASTSIARRFDVIRVEDLKIASMTRSRESQAVFRCTACGYACNADVNAARNIAAGHAVKARRGDRAAGPVNREPQLALLSA